MTEKLFTGTLNNNNNNNKKNYNMKYHVIVGRFYRLLMGCRVCEKVLIYLLEATTSRMSFKFSQIRPRTVEVAALERLEKSP